jgi:tape measure domain-containing protein
MGLSLEQQNRAFLAINQMMSKGTVQAEELRGQLGEALPGAFTIMAKAIGVTEKELGNMLKRGEVLAKDVLPAFATELEKAYGIENITNVKTLTAETNRLGNAWTNFVKEIDSGNGIISKFLTTMIGGITELIKDVSRLQKAWTFLDPDASMEKLRKSYRDDEKASLQRIGEQAGKDQIQQIKGLKAQTDYAKDLTRIKLEQSNLVGFKTLTANHRNPILTDIINYLENE